MRVPAGLPWNKGHASTLSKVVPKLAKTLTTLSLIDEAQSVPETVLLSRELLDSSFARKPLATGWRSDDGGSFSLAGGGRLHLERQGVPVAALSDFLAPHNMKRIQKLDDGLRQLFNGVHAQTVTTFPIASCGVLLGFFCLFDCELQEGDLLLIELITSRVASRLMLLKKEQEQAVQVELSSRLMSLAGTLLRSESKEGLYRVILDSATELLSACQGSVMLLDGDGENMQVVHAKGVGSEIARYMRVQVGMGIAGRVAQSGTALLVHDLELDPRTAMRNRARFKSKSLISIPLKLNEKVFGVLNLSDKANLSAFGEADLKLLTSFSTLASLMIERAQIQEETCRLEELSCTDPLTGTYNRRFLNSRLEEEVNRSQRQGLEFTLLFIDLDLFKSYNDRFGHLAGDEALKVIAEVIKGNLRDMDIVARFGGEEFCVLLPGTCCRLGELVAERIRQGIERRTSPEGGGAALLTASLGVACFPRDGSSAAALLDASDAALYQAKASGRNRVVTAQPGFGPAAAGNKAAGALNPAQSPGRII